MISVGYRLQVPKLDRLLLEKVGSLVENNDASYGKKEAAVLKAAPCSFGIYPCLYRSGNTVSALLDITAKLLMAGLLF